MMFGKLDDLVWTAQRKVRRGIHYLLHEEKGAADIVAILVMVVIVIGIAVTFRGRLINLVGSVFDKAETWVNEN